MRYFLIVACLATIAATAAAQEQSETHHRHDLSGAPQVVPPANPPPLPPMHGSFQPDPPPGAAVSPPEPLKIDQADAIEFRDVVASTIPPKYGAGIAKWWNDLLKKNGK